jgi:hypothetical protein
MCGNLAILAAPAAGCGDECSRVRVHTKQLLDEVEPILLRAKTRPWAGD